MYGFLFIAPLRPLGAPPGAEGRPRSGRCRGPDPPRPSALLVPPQVTLSSLHQFTFDYVYGGDHGRPPSELYGQCVKPLVEGLFRGYNATVLAYGYGAVHKK